MTAAAGAAADAVDACGIFTIRTCAATGTSATSPSPSTAIPQLRMVLPRCPRRGRPGTQPSASGGARCTGAVRVLAEHRVDAALPRPVEERELALGRRFVGLDDVDQRGQEDALVGAVAVGARTP